MIKGGQLDADDIPTRGHPYRNKELGTCDERFSRLLMGWEATNTQHSVQRNQKTEDVVQSMLSDDWFPFHAGKESSQGEGTQTEHQPNRSSLLLFLLFLDVSGASEP
mmetsp:Transcript_8791/g.23783  ORF Transcript_8791/g.23783 Transcript_8791/m.23783 type:complete len:107 (+) Transcript_8791:2785-3105(+)